MKMPHMARGVPAGPERTDASSPPNLGGRLRLRAAAVAPAQTGAPPPSSAITEGSETPWVAHLMLPPSVVLVDTRVEAPRSTAWPAELAAIAEWPAHRQTEHITARDCARQALASLGVAGGPILRDAKGAPIWPDGIIGSLTHCHGYRAAALARRGDLVTLGIDAEPAQALPAAVLERISSHKERARIAQLTSENGSLPWGRLWFSAKESVYKAWYPLTRVGLGFHQAEISLTPDGQGSLTWRRDLPPAASNLVWHLSWAVDDGIASTAVWA